MRLGHQEIIKPLPSEAFKPVPYPLSPVTCPLLYLSVTLDISKQECRDVALLRLY
ncbi:hypothetical protein Nos7524_2794 [Nostoc sp. PCC 7524]|nr:hypothetical protein Nos7524_2794 [Nostoc sp. PCC 7524]